MRKEEKGGVAGDLNLYGVKAREKGWQAWPVLTLSADSRPLTYNS